MDSIKKAIISGVVIGGCAMLAYKKCGYSIKVEPLFNENNFKEVIVDCIFGKVTHRATIGVQEELRQARLYNAPIVTLIDEEIIEVKGKYKSNYVCIKTDGHIYEFLFDVEDNRLSELKLRGWRERV